MGFNFSKFVKQGLIDAIGKQGDHWVILNAASWHEKGVLSESDLVEIAATIDVKNGVTEAETTDTEE